jgi:hypothetical protein
MKKLLVAMLALSCAAAITANAEDTNSSGSASDRKAERKALIEKYDANKDGKLDKDEVSKMSQEDKDKWKKLGGGHKKKKDASQ